MAQSSRDERLRANLRANLKRRNQQARAKAALNKEGDDAVIDKNDEVNEKGSRQS